MKIYISRNFCLGLDVFINQDGVGSTSVEIFVLVWTGEPRKKISLSTSVEIFVLVWTSKHQKSKHIYISRNFCLGLDQINLIACGSSTSVEIFVLVWT